MGAIPYQMDTVEQVCEGLLKQGQGMRRGMKVLGGLTSDGSLYREISVERRPFAARHGLTVHDAVPAAERELRRVAPLHDEAV